MLQVDLDQIAVFTNHFQHRLPPTIYHSTFVSACDARANSPDRAPLIEDKVMGLKSLSGRLLKEARIIRATGVGPTTPKQFEDIAVFVNEAAEYVRRLENQLSDESLIMRALLRHAVPVYQEQQRNGTWKDISKSWYTTYAMGGPLIRPEKRIVFDLIDIKDIFSYLP